MDDPVEAAELAIDRVGDRREVIGRCAHVIERKDRGLRRSVANDRVVQRLELADDATVQRNGRAFGGQCARQRLAETAGGAGDEIDAAGEASHASEQAGNRVRDLSA